MRYLLTGMIALTLLTACGQKDKAGGAGALAAIEYDVENLKEVSLRKGDPATASQALAALSLNASDAGRLSFANSDVSGDRAVFTDLTLLLPAEALTPAIDVGEGPSEADIDEMFAMYDEDGDGVADDGSGMTREDLAAMMAPMPPPPPSVPPVVKAAKLEFDGLGMFDGKANFSRMRLTDLSIAPGEGSEDRSTGKIASVELINPSAETAAWVASLLGKGDPAPMPQGPALAFDRWSVNGIDMNIDDGSGKGTFKVASMFIDSMNESKAGGIGLSKFNFAFNEDAGSDVNVSLDGFGLRGLNVGLFSDAFAQATDPQRAATELASALQSDPANPGFDAMSLKGFKADIIGASVDLAELKSSVSRDKQGRATKIVTPPFTVNVSARDNVDGEAFSGGLAQLGYEKLSLTAAGEQLYDPDADLVTLTKGKNYWELKDGFRLDLSAKYEGAKELANLQAYLAGNPYVDQSEQSSQLMKAFAIHQMELAFDDNGFFDRALNAFAAQSGQDPAALRQQMSGMVAMAPMAAGMVGVEPVVITELATAVGDFIRQPKTLTISLSPPSPIRAEAFVAAAQNPGDQTKQVTKAALGFSASNK